MLEDARYGAKQSAYQIIIGTDSLAVVHGNGDMWNSFKINSESMLVSYEGKPLVPFTRYYWSVKLWDADRKEIPAAISVFETGMMNVSQWKGAWIGDGPYIAGNGKEEKQAPYFRKKFSISKKIKSARAYIAAAGLYELFINGERIGDHRLDPMFTRYDRRLLYVTYDITNSLKEGQNAVGVLLGNGWYNHQSTAVWYFHYAPWRDRPAFCFDMRITYEDDSVEIISSDENWKSSFGEVVFNSIYTAEHHDARKAQADWNKPNFEDSSWKNPVIYRVAPTQLITAQQLYPIRNVEKLTPKTCTKINNQRYIYNLGQNIAGVSQLRVKGEAGTEIRLKHAEILRPDNTLYMNNIDEHYRPTDDTDPFQTDIFILSGKGEETFIPYFNYKGFQYVEVTSSKPISLDKENLSCWFMHSDVPQIGYFETSNPLLNRIWKATNNSYLSNLFGYPTDCPQREKNGWTGDANLAVELGLFNFDAITIYEKWMADHRDEQQPNGVLPSIIPCSRWGYEWANGPDWAGSIAIIPWTVYQFYGDSKLLFDCYDNIKRYVNRVEEVSPNGLTSWGLGDWIPFKTMTPQSYTSSIYYYRIVSILANAANLFGKNEDEIYYNNLAIKIKDAINQKYLNREKAIYGSGNQTELSTALCWGIVPDELVQRVADNLAKRVQADNGHLDLGMLGSRAIWQALNDNGYAQLAYQLASQTSYPSIGYTIVKDSATTLYEQWEAIGERKESSLNHVMWGSISGWFFRGLGGINIDPDKPGFKNILLKPHFVDELNDVRVSHNSSFGQIVSHWTKRKNKVFYRITIPANTTADFYIPAGYCIEKTMIDSKQPLKLIPNEKAMVSLLAGKYEIELKEIK
jgi:alpha-L-rhamnosidase